ncbi:hypothetical protein N7481_012318 [Penicillium waksmanii]|uniref:uncharacterized protein n=1 Tax=Penicillium waksmanii TaxID=69791 RepID=UPI002548266E|nr:uncharacterized protein N7481_012318 [Penicillium waksmanii]KAJ5965604.1 hypothetical protein N7481_012318 [Penicillium waksmanii]
MQFFENQLEGSQNHLFRNSQCDVVQNSPINATFCKFENVNSWWTDKITDGGSWPHNKPPCDLMHPNTAANINDGASMIYGITLPQVIHKQKGA